MADVKLDYISIGGNRHPAAADWNRGSGTVAFGADNNVALWNPLESGHKGVYVLLKGHTDAVNAVRFIQPACLNEPLLASGSSDKTVRLWRESESDSGNWATVAKLDSSPAASVNCIAVLNSHNLLVTGTADATVRIWKISSNETNEQGVNIELVTRLALRPHYFPLTIAIAALSGPQSNEFVLAVAGTKATIQVYATKGDSLENSFSLVGTLTGHEAWIRSLDITYESPDDPTSDLVIASASQDKYIRLWRIHRGQDLPTSSRALDDPTLGILAKSSLSNKAHRFTTASQHFSMTFEALLLGHEDWIYTASWHRFNGRLQLLSASADNSLAVWEADDTTGIWTCVARLGEISAQKGSTSATGSTGGFWLGLWSPDANSIISLGRTGGWRMWQRDADVKSDRWNQKAAVTGHTKEVNGIAWSRDGSYLLSTSNDQTTRLHAEWRADGSTSWHEFSRPQIHGYDLNCIDTIKDTQFISGADEKLLRVFDEPEGVANILGALCGIETPTNASLPDAANIPVLGLSNKAVEATQDDATPITNDESRDTVDAVPKSALKLTEPPHEDHLARHLLWPECEKLYGHGYEINCVAASHDGTLVATACRASSVDHAVIRLYDTKEWREVKPVLKAHTLTVTGLRFSPDDSMLLSVGRDRQFCVWRRKADGGTEYEHKHAEEKAHSRMVLVADWGPFGAKGVFATGGRDKSVKIWQLGDDGAKCVQTIATDAPVTALAFLTELVNNCLVLAYGLESGHLRVCKVKHADGFEVETIEPHPALRQSKPITQILWRPKGKETQSNGHSTNVVRQLAIASADSSLHVASISLS